MAAAVNKALRWLEAIFANHPMGQSWGGGYERHAASSCSPPVPFSSIDRAGRPGTATCAARISPGRSPLSCPMRRCSPPLSCIPSALRYGWPSKPSLYADLIADRS